LPPAFIQSASGFGALGGLAEGAAPLSAGDAKGGGAVEGVEASGPPGVGMAALLFGALAPSIAPPPVTPGQASALEHAATVKMAIKEPRINFLMMKIPPRRACDADHDVDGRHSFVCSRKICAARLAGPRPA
jgi:hypothetical protein